jgi:hypothetical protein
LTLQAQRVIIAASTSTQRFFGRTSMGRMDNKVAIMTGAARGIGAAAASPRRRCNRPEAS